MLRPVAFVVGEPVHRLLHRLCLDLAGDGAAALAAHDQAGIGQHVEVLHDGGQRHREGTGKLADADPVFCIEPGEQGAPRRIGQRREGAIESRGLIVNHRVKR